MRLANYWQVKFSLPVLIASILAVMFFLILPARSDVLALKQAIAAARQALEEEYQTGQQLKKTQAQYEAIEPDLARVKTSYLGAGQELYLITSLEQIASKYGLEQSINLDELILDQGSEQSDVIAVPVKVDLTGNFRAIFSYLADVESQNFYLNWQSVNIRSSQAASGQTFPALAPTVSPGPAGPSELRATLEGETYWLVN